MTHGICTLCHFFEIEAVEGMNYLQNGPLYGQWFP